MTADFLPVRRLVGMSRTRLVLLIIGVLFIGFLIWRGVSNAKASQANANNKPRDTPVEIATATRSDIPVYLEGLGSVQAFYTVTVTSRVDGELQKVAFTEGQTVRRGDLLAQIDPRPYEGALDQATATRLKDEAQLANARHDLERYEELAPHELASKQTVETQRTLVAQLEAQVRGDQATINTANAQLGYTHITSPIDGRTGIRMIDPGNIVHGANASAIVVVTQVQPISVLFTLPEEAVPTINEAIRAGKVKVVALSRDGKTEFDRGVLTLIDNQIDQTTGTVKLKATFPNERNALWPGEFVNARVLVETQRNALTIPSSAVMRGVDGMFTYVLKSDTVEARPLKVGVEEGAQSVIEEGLQEGEQVVTTNQYRLQPGARVHVTTSAEVAERDAATHKKPSS